MDDPLNRSNSLNVRDKILTTISYDILIIIYFKPLYESPKTFDQHFLTNFRLEMKG